MARVLRLFAQGLSYREIGQSVGISASTVQGYLERAQRAGLSWPLPDDQDDAGIEARLFTRTEEELRPGRPEPDWLAVHRQRKRGKHVTLQLLHREYKAVHPEGLSYAQFCVHCRRWRARQDVVRRLEYAAGERRFVDFAGDTVSVTDPETCEIWQAQVFVSVLGASGYLYVKAARISRHGWVPTCGQPTNDRRRRHYPLMTTTVRPVSDISIPAPPPMIGVTGWTAGEPSERSVARCQGARLRICAPNEARTGWAAANSPQLLIPRG